MGIIKGIRDSISRAVDRLFAEDEQKRIGIYGPPNAGKCLAADEQVLLSDGTYASIEEVFEFARDACPEAEDVSDERNETWLPVGDADLEVPALSGDLRTADGEVSHVFRQRYQGPMYRVRTRSGRSVTVSPNIRSSR
jgi:intein/homing endonuclease